MCYYHGRLGEGRYVSQSIVVSSQLPGATAVRVHGMCAAGQLTGTTTTVPGTVIVCMGVCVCVCVLSSHQSSHQS